MSWNAPLPPVLLPPMLPRKTLCCQFLPPVPGAAPTYPCPAPALISTAEEIMGLLRQSYQGTDAAFTAGWQGWGPGDTPNPCHWQHVACNAAGNVTSM